jgi:hypothetical protein
MQQAMYPQNVIEREARNACGNKRLKRWSIWVTDRGEVTLSAHCLTRTKKIRREKVKL